MTKPNFSLIGFLAMAFAVVGLAGIMASYTAAVPLERAMVREAALDEALAAAGTPDPAAALEALRPRLADSAAAFLPYRPDAGASSGRLAAQIAAERIAMRARLSAEADEVGRRLRWLIGVLTVMALAFATLLLRAAGRAG